VNKIGIVTNGVRNDEFGGSHIYLSQLCRRLAQDGWDITLFSYESAFDVFPEREHFVSLGRGFGIPKQLYSINHDLLQLEERLSELDVIHTDWWLAAPALRKVTRKYGIRYIHDSRNSLFDVNRIQNVYKWLVMSFLHPDHIMFVDHVSHSIHQNKFWHKASSMIPVPIDTDLFSSKQETIAPNINREQPIRLLFASWLRKEKGLLDLLDALEKVWQMHPSVELFIAGEGYLRKQIETLEVKDERITYLGRVPNQEMAEIYAQVDLLVYPSYFEGFPRTILEAYACGVPTVATEVGGLSLLREKNIGLIVQPGDVDNLAEAICCMIEKSALRRQFSTDGQTFVMQEHSWPMVFEKITQIYCMPSSTYYS